MEFLEFITPYLGEFLTALISISVTWLFSRKRQQAELITLEIDNGKKIIELYQSSLDDLNKRHEELFKELKDMYESKFETFRAQIKELHSELELWKSKYEMSQKELKEKNEKGNRKK